MTRTHGNPRERAEAAFARLQSKAPAPDLAVREGDLITEAREKKTSRLREARLAKEMEDRAKVAAAPSNEAKRNAKGLE